MHPVHAGPAKNTSNAMASWPNQAWVVLPVFKRSAAGSDVLNNCWARRRHGEVFKPENLKPRIHQRCKLALSEQEVGVFRASKALIAKGKGFINQQAG